MIFTLIDLILLALCGVMAKKLPEDSQQPLPAPWVHVSFAVGLIAIVRGIWRGIVEIPGLFSSTSEGSTMLLAIRTLGLVSSVTLVLVGFLVAQQRWTEATPSTFVREIIEQAGAALWPARRVVAYTALLVAVAQLAPFVALR